VAKKAKNKTIVFFILMTINTESHFWDY